MRTQHTDPLEDKPIGPLAVEPEQWSQGARIAICHHDRGVIAVIEPINYEDDPTMETAQREPFDEAYARLFAASPDLLNDVKRLYDLYRGGKPEIESGHAVVKIEVSAECAGHLRHVIAVAEGAEEAARRS